MCTHVYCRYRKFPSTVFFSRDRYNIYKGRYTLVHYIIFKGCWFLGYTVLFSNTYWCWRTLSASYFPQIFIFRQKEVEREKVYMCVCERERMIVGKEKSFTLQKRILWNWVFLEHANYISALVLWCIYARNKRPLRFNYIYRAILQNLWKLFSCSHRVGDGIKTIVAWKWKIFIEW